LVALSVNDRNFFLIFRQFVWSGGTVIIFGYLVMSEAVCSAIMYWILNMSVSFA